MKFLFFYNVFVCHISDQEIHKYHICWIDKSNILKIEKKPFQLGNYRGKIACNLFSLFFRITSNSKILTLYFRIKISSCKEYHMRCVSWYFPRSIKNVTNEHYFQEKLGKTSNNKFREDSAAKNNHFLVTSSFRVCRSILQCFLL